ncbi:hypothetical protein SERLA73DRAFT_43855 [Serpula lacrymans var. lacrymans S7.3]|uniref:Uncharacterized protein n=2 Tax=Serpula lacrymans var. lacrymans TaxID=341189 RepID=F8PI77_SERL3|nr:uncharacterized protein SERLADRAFT_344367 [Serpula lacrymans var. lacrymans S7.9]EGO05120.1 hypothetical protein SERLA73DRAFT_43855 [Serpula lacrymans var. lacrymans S7.3]EGO30875.1 hypothetical protein SERLADRAFT_344367 [Serpula lacrymans var. lacrymans S7.9]
MPTLGLYSALQACNTIVFRLSRQLRLTVAKIFCNVRTILLKVVICCFSRVSGAGVVATGVATGVKGASDSIRLGAIH